jgi:hypothetical protein
VRRGCSRFTIELQIALVEADSSAMVACSPNFRPAVQAAVVR